MTRSQLLSSTAIPAASRGRGAPKEVNQVPNHRPNVGWTSRHCRAARSPNTGKSDGNSAAVDASDSGHGDSDEDPDDGPESPSQEGTDEDERFLTSRAVRARYGNCSDMWIYRRLHDGSGFPQPLSICGRRFWKLSGLIAWERARAMGAA